MTDPLRVLLLAGPIEVRGTSRQTMNLAKHLESHNVRPEVVCADAHVLPEMVRRELSHREAPFLQGPLLERFGSWLLSRELRRDPPDLIHVQQRSMLAVGRALAHAIHRPYVVSIHDYLGPRETVRFEWVWCRRVIAVSESVKRELQERAALPDERITVIHSGVDTDVRGIVSDVLEPQRAPVIGTIGPLEVGKGLNYFLDAAPKVIESFPDAEILVAGAGPEERNLRKQVRDLGIGEHVTFVPEVMDLDSSLMAMDLFVLPSIKQGLGTMMLEAMVRGRPVIATRAGGVHRTVEDGVTGLLVPPRDSDALARSIVELLRDPLRARMMARAARDMVRAEFPVDRMVEQTANLYRAVARAASC